jgi:predicted AAA+ superfamily ATPase
MIEPTLYERFLRKPLEEALEDTPVVLIHGPRQCGKTTLARMVGDAGGYEYISFDDDVQLAAATADPVLAASLLGVDSALLYKDRTLLGQILETFVFQELKRQAGWNDRPVQFYHFRDKDGFEVDIVLEHARKVAGVEIKAASTVTKKDFRGLAKLKETMGDRFVAGVVMYDGESAVGFGEGLYAVPIPALWETY